MSKTIEEILSPKPEIRPRIYAYSIADEAHKGLLKVGQTTRDVKRRIAEQLKTAAIKNYKIELDESAEGDDGTIITDHDVRAALVRKKFENRELEWMRCTIPDLKTVLTELRTGQSFTGTHHETFPMRAEQAEAVKKTHAYSHSIWKEDMHAVPRFLWNAKMRFGKTFTAYQLAKKLGAKRVLVVTFKPAVEDAWRTDLESHVDFDGWQYLSRSSDSDPTEIMATNPVVYFGSFQDLLGCDAFGNIKCEKRMAPRGELGTSLSLTNTISARGGKLQRNCSRVRRRPSPKRKLNSNTATELTDEEREYKSMRKRVQEKLIKFATRIPAFIYLTDFREYTLQDVITRLEPDLFLVVTRLTVKDFLLLVRLRVFNTEQMNQAVFAFRRYEDASLNYTGIESHEGLTHYGLYDTVVARD